MNDQKNHIDAPLLFAVLTLMALSLGVVYSASATWAQYKFGEAERLLNSHAFKIVLGVVALFIGMNIRYGIYRERKITKLAVIVAVFLLLLTFVAGGEVKGASRWLRLGSLGFQPSEFAKFALLFHLAALISTKGEFVRDFKVGFMPMMVWIGAVSTLVLLQPNFSTGSMIMILSILLLFLGRVRVSHLMGIVAVGIALLVIIGLAKPHVVSRIESHLSGTVADGRPNYQLYQGIIGFGNGGVFGVGPGESKQRDFFLPESYGDFVFSIIGEEYGFVGTMFFLVLYFFIMARGFKIARFARDDFGYYLSIGITGMISAYALVNAAVTLGLLPTTGLPMPFVSYGGSSILFSAFAVGVLLNISAYTDLHPRAVKIPVVGIIDANSGSVGITHGEIDA
jgi:cell division protein FtsW